MVNSIKKSRIKGIIYIMISIFLLLSIAMTGYRVYGLNTDMKSIQEAHDSLQR